VAENIAQDTPTRHAVASQYAWCASYTRSCALGWSCPGGDWAHRSRQACEEGEEEEHAGRCLAPLRCVTHEHGTRDVPRTVLGKPRLLDLHPPHTADGTLLSAAGEQGRRGAHVPRRARRRGRAWGLPEEFPTPWEHDFAAPIRVAPIVPHPLQPPRQDMQEKAAQEFDGVEGPRPLLVTMAVILPPKRHLAIRTGEEPPIGDRHAMGVACQGAEDVVWPGQGRLGVDAPVQPLHGAQELMPDRWGGPARALPLHTEALLGGCLPQGCQEAPSKQPAEDAYREEEPFGTGHPGGAIQRQSPRRHQTMDMGMMG
jgi:hypothetical protein